MSDKCVREQGQPLIPAAAALALLVLPGSAARAADPGELRKILRKIQPAADSAMAGTWHIHDGDVPAVATSGASTRGFVSLAAPGGPFDPSPRTLAGMTRTRGGKR